MQNVANSVLIQKPNYSKHNLTSETKTTGNLGQLIPIFLQEVVPGDNIDINAEFLTKFQPLQTPALQNFNAYLHYFYVPFRILWKNWKYFIAQTPAPGMDVPPLHPMITFTDPEYVQHGPSTVSYDNHNLAPYFGINGLQLPANESTVNAFPFLAYQLIWNEYYRHEKIHDDISPELIIADGAQALNVEWNKVRYRTYKDDYFTSALPSPQEGNEAATTNIFDNTDIPVYSNSVIGTPGSINVGGASADTADVLIQEKLSAEPTLSGQWAYVSLNDANTSISMNDLIELSRMQEFLVRNNLAGNRYNEFILAHFGVRIPDLRLDRPQYITGVKAPVIISELLNQSEAQGTQTGQGNGYSEGGRGNFRVDEHGIILGIYSCIPTQSYTKAVPKLMFKQNAMDYYLPVFDQMGEQEIENRELNILHTTPMGTFGYVPRYAEYRLPFNMVTGEFTTNLTEWHLAQIHSNSVALNESFFDINQPSRVFAVNEELADSILIQVLNHVYIDRPMSKYSMPVITNNYSNQLM